ncbi:MAG: DUF192 domain-containing protein [Spirochaetaceae bacterium]|nr:DUF192 domain-containing protein [Spirochaetaceae bacterium]
MKKTQHLKLKKLFLVLIFTTATFVACSKVNSLEEITLKIIRSDESIVSLQVEVADTEEARARGYMERDIIPEGTGMLFVFPKSQILSFWMKNTPHPLSIAYIDSRGTIFNIYHMTPYSESTWSSTDFAQYALEVPQGWFEKNGIKIGDRIELKNIQQGN